MCCWMGSYFQDWIDFNGVAFSIELLEWGCAFSDFCCEKVLHIYGQQTYQNARPHRKNFRFPNWEILVNFPNLGIILG